MNAELRTYLKAQIDAVRRQRITAGCLTECLWCGDPLPADTHEGLRKFCGDTHRKAWASKYGQYLPPSHMRTAPGRCKYLTEEERVEARRATWRKNRRNQYALYRTLTEQFGVPRNKKWGSHLAELRRREAA